MNKIKITQQDALEYMEGACAEAERVVELTRKTDETGILTGRGEKTLAIFHFIHEQIKQQVPRLLTADEVIGLELGSVVWVEEAQSVTWNLFPLEVDVISQHPDTGTHYIFYVAYHSIEKYELDEYNQTWRCWSTKPTDAQRKAAAWESARMITCGPDYCDIE